MVHAVNDYRTYKIIEGDGSGGFLCPPGHPNHRYSLHEFVSPRGRKVIGIFSIDYALLGDHAATPQIKLQVAKIYGKSELVCSEKWIRHVYGYFRNCYLPESGEKAADKLLIVKPGQKDDQGNPIPLPSPERHRAADLIREYFPDHQPREDLIAHPGKGYGSWPCVKCGNRVQYEERLDAYAIVTTRMTSEGMTLWTRNPECPKGGQHEIEEQS